MLSDNPHLGLEIASLYYLCVDKLETVHCNSQKFRISIISDDG